MKHPTMPGAASILLGGVRTTSADEDKVQRKNKTTIYLSDEEVVELDRARLELREATGVPIDRGRLLRCAYLVAMENPDVLQAALMRGDGA
jgi:hypothetical protein